MGRTSRRMKNTLLTRRLSRIFVGVGTVCIFAIISVICLTQKLPNFSYGEFQTSHELPQPYGDYVPFDPLKEPSKPYLYNITIIPDVKSHSFSGTAIVHFNASETVKSVFMHLGSDVKLVDFEYKHIRYNGTDDLFVDLGKEVIGNFEIEFKFSSPLSDNNHGLYATHDLVSGCDGVSTQFEATHARRVFPCHDSPSSKAVFALNIFAEGNMMAIANTPPREIETLENGRMFRFQDTPKMSPYLVAFAVGKWDMISDYTKRGVPVDVYVPVKQIESGKFALKFAKDSIDIFEQKFGIEYPLPRLQLVSIPDFAAGAMENWGLVTFRDQALLAIDGVSSLSALERVAEVVVHENAHMWAGDLVSPTTWKDLWLNEGFATLLPLICIPEIDSRFSGWTSFYRFEVQEAIAFDFSKYTHPIIAEVDSTDDAASIFDSISYSKGATVLNMLSSLMKPDVFWKSVAEYFKEFAYSDATTSDLVKSFERTSGIKIADFMEMWTKEPGFPTVKVTRKDGKYRLKQRRLMLDGSEEEKVWPLPLTRSDTGETFNMMEAEIEITSDFATFNDGRTSMAMIEYDDDLLDELVGKYETLSVGAKWMLFEDLTLLVIAQKKHPQKLLNLVMKVANETDKDVLEAAISAASYLYVIDRSVKTGLYKVFEPFLDMKREENETLLASRIRVQLLRLLGLRFENANVVKILEEIDPRNAPEDIMAVAMAFKGKTDFEYVRNMYSISTVPQVKVAALAAMGATEVEKDIRKAFEMLLDGLKTHEVPTLVSALAGNEKAREGVVPWIKANIESLIEMYGSGFQMQRILESGISSITDEKTLTEFSKWCENDTRLDALKLTIGRISEYTLSRITLSKKLTKTPLIC